MAFTIADGVVLLIVSVSALLAYSRGLTREALAIGGWIIAAMAAFFFAPILEPLMREIPVVGGFLASSCTLSILAGFAAAFAIALVVLSIFTPLLSGLVRDSALGPFDRGLGFLFGVVRGVALAAVLYLLYDLTVPTEQRIAAIDGAWSMGLIGDAANLMRTLAPEDAPEWLGSRIDRLMGACEPGGQSAMLSLFKTV
jgi:membrane protein required for colicin V production